MSAVQAKRMGKSVIIVGPDVHLGGLSSGGLGFTDTGDKSVIGGLAREFYHRIWGHYDKADAWRWQRKEDYGNKGQGTPAIDGEQRTMWIFEPHVAEKVFEDLIAEHDIPVRRDEWLDRSDGVTVESGRIVSIKMLNGRSYSGRMFIDATYEGDLMAAAGVAYAVGRESVDGYDEKWNGVQTGVLHHRHHFGAVKEPIDPYVVPGDPSSGVLPLISAEPPGEYGSADKRVQAYCYRLCMTRVPENRIPFSKPANYDPANVRAISGRVYDAGWHETFDKFDPVPNLKTDTNNHGPVSNDNIGMNYAYPEASYEERKRILQQHHDYQMGLLYYTANDPRVPDEIRNRMAEWGLAKDEFIGQWRMAAPDLCARGAADGREVRHDRERTGETKRPTPESVGMGSYTIDSHNVQRYITPEGHVQNEGDIGVSTKGPYQIAYGSLVPKKQDCENLLVPICVSATHIAFGSIRMEPVFMILGQSAATAAAMAIDNEIAVQDVGYDQLRERLLADGQILEKVVAGRAAMIDYDEIFGRTSEFLSAKGIEVTLEKGDVLDEERDPRIREDSATESSKCLYRFLHSFRRWDLVSVGNGRGRLWSVFSFLSTIPGRIHSTISEERA